MLRKRIIFTLIYADGAFNQSRNFRLQKVGNLSWLEKNYHFQKIAFSLDELIVLNASKENKDINSFSQMLSQLVDDVFIPIAAGGGIRNMQDAELLFASGADKIVLNTALHTDKKLVSKLVARYGSQSVIACIDYKKNTNGYSVFIQDGNEQLSISLVDYIKEISKLNVGEIYLNSIEQDGTGFGYDFGVVDEIQNNISTPLIMAGGAGNEKHLIEGLLDDRLNAVATANLFNFIGDGLPYARQKAIGANCNLAHW